jgi:DNA-binding PadR family transcriptional regulator
MRELTVQCAFKTRATATGVAVALMSMSGLVQAGVAQPGPHELTRAVNQYLAEHGDLCVGKFSWPRIVTPEDREARTNDAVQLPVLERLGLVESTDGPVKSYSLSEKGRRYYLRKRRITVGAHDRPTAHDADLCVARLSLDKVVKWSPPEQVRGHVETVVHYTYHIREAKWMDDPQARQVFPVVDRIIRHQDNMLMSVTVRLEDDKWQPVLPDAGE